jgi:hypothetical protein
MSGLGQHSGTLRERKSSQETCKFAFPKEHSLLKKRVTGLDDLFIHSVNCNIV